MKYILIVLIIFINLLGNETNKLKNFEELNIINNIIKDNLGNRLNEFKNQNIKFIVNVKVIENNKYNYSIIEKSNNNEFNKIIEKFIIEENGKKYINNPKYKSINITFKPVLN